VNIWCISKYALPEKYGAQQRLFMLSKWFNLLNHKSIVITSSTNHLALDLPEQKKVVNVRVEDESRTVFLKGLKIKKSQSLSRIISWTLFELRLYQFSNRFEKYDIEKPDVVLVSSLSLFTVLNGIRIKNKYNAKLVFEIRDIWPLTAILITGASKWHPLMLFMRYVEKLGYSKANLISSPLPNLPAHIRQSIKGKFNFHYTPQGYELKKDSHNKKLEVSFIEEHIKRDKFNVLYIGNLVMAYDLDSLIALAKRIEKIEPNIHFVVLGDGSYKNQMIQMSEGLSNISFAPRIPKTEVQDFLNHCQVATNFLRPESLFEYGVSPQKIIDYFLAKKPILMSYSGFPSLVLESGAGFEINAGDIDGLSEKLMEMYRMKKEDLDTLGLNGYNYLVKNLNWEYIANQYLISIEQS